MSNPLSIATDGYLHGVRGIATGGYLHVDENVVRTLYRHDTFRAGYRPPVSVFPDRGLPVMLDGRAVELPDAQRGANSYTILRESSVTKALRQQRVLSLVRSVDLVNIPRVTETQGVGTSGYLADVVFPRGNFTSMILTIKSNEELGILDTDYVEDYFGTDGFMSVRRVSDGFRDSIPMTPVPGETPGIDNDVFRGTLDLTTMPNGTYELEGRVRDIMGNYTIFGAVQTPIGGENVSTLTLEIIDGFAARYVHNLSVATIRPQVIVAIDRSNYTVPNVRSSLTADTTRRFVEILTDE